MTITRPGHLPDFEAPPITEVALSVQFQQITGYGFVEIGLLWERFRQRFSRVEYHPPLSPTFETFGLRQGAVQHLAINFGSMPPIPRTWFVDASGTQILQIQPDRFVHNWRKVETDHVYPRFEQIRANFSAELEELREFLADNNMGSLVPNQCEVTYVNAISAPDGFGDPTSKVFKGWQSEPSPYLGEVEDISFAARFIIQDDQQEPIGRLIAQSMPGLDANGQSIIHLTLVGRGPPLAPSIEGALNFMDVARERIVCGFAEMTTDQMHLIWKRRN